MEFPNLPDTTPKLIVSIGIILMWYFYNSEQSSKTLLDQISEKKYLATKEIVLDSIKWRVRNDRINEEIEVIHLTMDSMKENGVIVVKDKTDEEKMEQFEQQTNLLNRKARMRDSVIDEMTVKIVASETDKIFYNKKVISICDDINHFRRLELFGLFLFSIGLLYWNEKV